MQRNDLVARIAADTGTNADEVKAVVGAALAAIVDAVASGDRVTLAGFGTFEPRERAARTGRNPRTGEELAIAASVIPAFKPAGAFKQRVAR